MKNMLTVLIAAMLLMMAMAALAQTAEQEYPVSAWTTREVDTYSMPKESAQDGGLIAMSGWVTWLDTQGEWARIYTQGEECYVPVDALTTDRVFQFDSHPTKSAEWPYAGELRVSPDGTVRIAISMAEEYESLSVFGGAELLCFEVVDEYTGELICTAEPDPKSDPMIYVGEGVYTEGTALLIRPILSHSGYSVQIQW